MKRLSQLLFPLCFAVAAAAQNPPVNPDSAILQDFSQRVSDYVKLHKAAQSEVHRLKLTTSPAALQQYERRLAHAIRAKRRNAKPGDIFTPQIAAEFRRLIGMTMQGPEAARIQQSLRNAAPVHIPNIRPNRPYPAGVPLQSTPPTLLLNLPSLPPEVDYRVAGRNLILRDADANMVVDYVANALPAPQP